jgi:hypothetical protein
MNTKLLSYKPSFTFTKKELNTHVSFDFSNEDIDNARSVGYEIEYAMGHTYYCQTTRSDAWEMAKKIRGKNE